MWTSKKMIIATSIMMSPKNMKQSTWLNMYCTFYRYLPTSVIKSSGNLQQLRFNKTISPICSGRVCWATLFSFDLCNRNTGSSCNISSGSRYLNGHRTKVIHSMKFSMWLTGIAYREREAHNIVTGHSVNVEPLLLITDKHGHLLARAINWHCTEVRKLTD